MWNLDQIGQAYSTRPSAIVGIEDDWAAYQFDLACYALGRHVEAELMKKRPIGAILGEGPRGNRAGFGDVRSLGPVRTMKLPEDGVW